MTVVSMAPGEIRAEGHAGNRDVCLFVEASFQMAARTMLGHCSTTMDESAPLFRIDYSPHRDEPAICALHSILFELAARYPENLMILRRDAAEVPHVA